MTKRPDSSDDFDAEDADLEAEAGKPAPDQETSDSAPSAPSRWRQYDLGVIIFALAIFAGGVLAYRSLTRPALLEFDQSGLHFQRPAGWLPGVRPIQRQAALGGAFGAPAPTTEDGQASGFHLVYTSPRDARLRLEVLISDPPRYKNLSGALSVARMARYGEYYWVRQSHPASIARRDWLRTEFRYAFKADKAGSPQLAEAIEYATMTDEHLYVVVAHGDSVDMDYLDALLNKSLRVVAAQGSPE